MRPDPVWAATRAVADTVRMDKADGLVDDHRRRRRETAQAGTGLTDREIAVLELIGAGLSNQEIAERLYLSINTLKTYIRAAYRKIGVSRRAHAVLWAAHHDLVPTRGTANPPE